MLAGKYLTAIAELEPQVPEKSREWPRLSVQILFAKPERELQVAMISRLRAQSQADGASPALFVPLFSSPLWLLRRINLLGTIQDPRTVWNIAEDQGKPGWGF